LDINMPEMGGVEVCKTIRRDSNIAIIMLTVRKSDADKVAALDAGADDFVTKPFSTPELLARVRAALRRVPLAQGTSIKLQFGQLAIDFGARTVTRGSKSSHLTPKELDVLRYLTQHANEAVSHRELLQSVWGPDYGDQVDYLRVVVKNLRRKIELRPEDPHFIKTEPWIGYRFDTSQESS
jgi:two-component system, OmpR family, KDP operon response regulator KdpE